MPVSTPKASDYVPVSSPTVAGTGLGGWQQVSTQKPQVSDYERVSINHSPQDRVYDTYSEEPPLEVNTYDIPQKDIAERHIYSEQELREIGSRPKEEIVDFFHNIGGSIKTTTLVDEDGKLTGYSYSYSSPLLDNKEFKILGNGKAMWKTYSETDEGDSAEPALLELAPAGIEAPPMLETVEIETAVVRAGFSTTIDLTEAEIQRILAAQQGIRLETPSYLRENEEIIWVSLDDFPSTDTSGSAFEAARETPPAAPVAERPSENGVTQNPPVRAAETPPAAPPETAVPAKTESGNAAAAESSVASPSADTASAQEDVAAAENTAPAADGAQTQNPHPQTRAADAVGTAATLAQSALGNPHQGFMAEAERLKNMASQKHDLASGFSQTIMEFEEGRIYDERRAYYANNREALNEAVEKIRADAAELTQKHGEAAGKTHFIGGAMKILGGVGSAIDAYELGSRINTAWKDGNWDPVAGQITKIAASAAAVSGSAAIARAIGLGLMAWGAPVGAVTAITILGGVVLTYYALEAVNELDKEISNANRFDFSSNSEDKYTDLVLIGNHSHSGDTKLEAETVTLIGNHRFENLEIDGKEVTVIGNIDSDGKFIINADTVNATDGSEISPDFIQKSEAENTDTAAVEDSAAEAAAAETADPPTSAAESAETRPFDQVQADEPYVNWDYVEAAAAQRQINTGEYLRSLVELPDMEGFFNREIIGEIKQYQNAEWEKVFSNPAVSEEAVSIPPEESPAYPGIPQPETQIQIQENPII
ncbi:hypothetical protein [Neisseria sp.]|uniref:hypothetical protein n=1 Tax=Neisseria sp. TaxID=192066 RepID=UPI0026DCBE21|nr:hypothetical protein [Neisseria sp.]MDO4907904.1 hypothetical protein [Neisseria sp.]